MVEDVSSNFEALGAWRPPLLHRLRADFMPWLYAEVDQELNRQRMGARLVDALIEHTLQVHEARVQSILQQQQQQQTTEGRSKKVLVRLFLQVGHCSRGVLRSAAEYARARRRVHSDWKVTSSWVRSK
jgi:hypothetical protein